MPTVEVLAVAPGLPVDDLLARPEGGSSAALRAIATLVPGATFEHVRTGTWAAPGESSADDVLVSTFGETAMFVGTPVPPLTVPSGMSTFSLSYQTVSMAYGVVVSGPQFDRLIMLSPGAVDHAEGPPLPFEAGFADVSEASASHSFDDDAFAAAAAQWMFGCKPLDPRPEDQVVLGSQPIHVFAPVAAPVAPERPTPAARRGGFRSLFGRR